MAYDGHLPPPFPSSIPDPARLAGSSRYPAMDSRPGSIAPGAIASSSSMDSPRFDIFDWYPSYQSCQRYFLDHAQHEGQIQAMAALINIRLPYQYSVGPSINSQPSVSQYRSGSHSGTFPASPSGHDALPPGCSLVPYIRRLVVTGMDSKAVLHGFFGNDWAKGVAPFWECERRNYLFSAKGIGMAKTKAQYDMNPYETVPFMRPLDAAEAELTQAEKVWSEWLRMEDWMLGERAPDQTEAGKQTER